MTYSEQLKDPRWQRKRLEILGCANFTCVCCGNNKETLHVHHRYYVAHRYPWEYPLFCFQVLCIKCHENIKTDVEDRRQNAECVIEDWEHGLDHFGEGIFNMAAEETVGG